MWGKLLGGTFGFLIGGPIGALLGAVLGHSFDKGMQAQLTHDEADDEGLQPGDAGRIKMAFFTVTFSVMGHIAKADGHVHPSEIALADANMKKMKLDSELRALAIKLFNQGKQPEFDAEAVVLQFRQECQRRTSLYRMFVEIQIQAALADGTISVEEERALLKVAAVLGFTEYTYRQIEMLVRYSMGAGQRHSDSAGGAKRSSGRKAPPVDEGRLSVSDAYRALGVERSADKATVKRAYRRLMSQHHPDKLIAKGLPEEMIKLATDKTQFTQKAYEKIKEARGWR
ncbi:MAG: co-chaperone DjlA [Granulosicoccus sp.]